MRLSRPFNLSIILLLLLLPLCGFAEEFRGDPKTVVEVDPADREGVTTPLAIGEVLFISQDDPHAFLEGVELEVRPPTAALAEAFAVSITIHHSKAPFPGPGVRVLSGDLLLQEELRPVQRFFYRFPVSNGVSFRRQADTRVLADTVSLSEERPVTIGFWPRMKGLPSAIMDGPFAVTVRPVLADRGGARLELIREGAGTPISADEEELALRINGESVSTSEEIYFLPSGLHRIRVDSDRFAVSETTFAVERGRITPVTVSLQSLSTVVRFSLPEEVALYLNGNPLDHTEGSAELPVGEHLVVMELGGYTVQQMITLETGRSYELGIDLDVFLQEN
ncbi:MAG: hypothetical protein ACLFP6_12255 [Spirochaetaceae bacterium]